MTHPIIDVSQDLSENSDKPEIYPDRHLTNLFPESELVEYLSNFIDVFQDLESFIQISFQEIAVNHIYAVADIPDSNFVGNTLETIHIRDLQQGDQQIANVQQHDFSISLQVQNFSSDNVLPVDKTDHSAHLLFNSHSIPQPTSTNAQTIQALDIGPIFAKGGVKGPPSGGGDGGDGGTGDGGSNGGGKGNSKNKNSSPSVESQTVSAVEDGPTVAGMLVVNDADESDTHVFNLVTGPSEGNVVVNADGSFEFDPGADFQDLAEGETREVNFTVDATDSSGARNATSELATITVVVMGINDSPVANDDNYSVESGETLVVNAAMGVLVNDVDIDGDMISVELVSGPANGNLVLNQDGSFEYNHSGNSSDPDLFIYKVVDPYGNSNQAVVNINVGSVPNSSGLQINLIDIGGAAPGSLAGEAFAVAAGFWEDLLLDPIVVNLNVGFSALGAGILGSTSSSKNVVDYSSLYNALNADQTSQEDSMAVDALQSGPSIIFYTNDPLGNFYLDNNASANNTYFNVNTANLKSLGLLNDESTVDGTIQFSSNFNFDFDSSDGVSAGSFDFVSIAVHEIGHALGFVSGVDVLDYYSGNGPGNISSFDSYAIFNTLDLYRYSNDSLGYDMGLQDLGFQDRGQYFSIDGGLSIDALLSTGSYNGDGRQASHWKDNQSLGIMDPTFSSGELGVITENDILAFDVIGYDIVAGASNVPLFSQLDNQTLEMVNSLVDDGLLERSYISEYVHEIAGSVLASNFSQEDIGPPMMEWG